MVHIANRGFHGFRRHVVDLLVERGATSSEIQGAGTWATHQIPNDIYHDAVAAGDGIRAAELLDSSLRQPLHNQTRRVRPAEVEVHVDYPATCPDLAHTLRAQNLSETGIAEVGELSKWAWEELNLRPHAYQACALTT